MLNRSLDVLCCRDHQDITLPFRLALKTFAVADAGVLAAVGRELIGVGLVCCVVSEVARNCNVVLAVVDGDRARFGDRLPGEIAAGWNQLPGAVQFMMASGE